MKHGSALSTSVWLSITPSGILFSSLEMLEIELGCTKDKTRGVFRMLIQLLQLLQLILDTTSSAKKSGSLQPEKKSHYLGQEIGTGKGKQRLISVHPPSLGIAYGGTKIV